LVYGPGRSPLSGATFDDGANRYVLAVYDVGIRAAPVLLAMLVIPDSVGGMLSTNLVVRGGHAFFVNGAGVVEVDVSDPRDPWQTGWLPMGDYDPESLDVDGDFLYVQCQHTDLFVYDISRGLSQAVELAHLGTHVAEITRLHGYQLLSATANGLYLTDVPRSPSEPAWDLMARWREADEPAGDPTVCDEGDTGNPEDRRCGCATGSSAAPSFLLLLAPLMVRRRSR